MATLTRSNQRFGVVLKPAPQAKPQAKRPPIVQIPARKRGG